MVANTGNSDSVVALCATFLCCMREGPAYSVEDLVSYLVCWPETLLREVLGFRRPASVEP